MIKVILCQVLLQFKQQNKINLKNYLQDISIKATQTEYVIPILDLLVDLVPKF